MKCSGTDALTGTQTEISFNGTIQRVETSDARPANRYVAPGLIDLQVNGFIGVDYNNPKVSHEDISRSIKFLFSTGVTRFLPTVITGSPENMRDSLWNLAEAKERLPEGAAIEGFHVEGPFISPEDGPRGAHPQRWVRPPSFEEFQRMQGAARGLIKLFTISPEWPEALKFIEAVVREGVVVSIGHTKATAAQIQDAVAAGASMSTHLGNGAHSVLARHPNYIWEQLAEDRLTAGFIVDGIHLPASFLKVALRAKGLSRSVLVTDASMPAGCKPGRYMLGEQEVELTSDDRVVLAGQNRLAGSSLRMNRGVSNLMNLAGLTLKDAVTLATLNPARTGKIKARQNGLAAGEAADLIEFKMEPGSNQIEILKTYLNGQLVYSA